MGGGGVRTTEAGSSVEAAFAALVARLGPGRDAGEGPADEASPDVRAPRSGRTGGVGAGPVLRAPGEVLDGTAGGDLAAVVADLVPADLDRADLLDAVAACERLMSWTAARQASVLQELQRRATGADAEFLVDEVATRLTMSSRAADLLLERAQALDVVPGLADALAAGHVDTRRTDAVVRATRHLEPERARVVVTTVLPRLDRLTAPQARAAVRRAEASSDPSAFRRRHAAARADRCVRLVPAPDAMAWVTAFMPADDAMTVMAAVDAVAAAAAPDDVRTLAQRRADALTDVLAGVLATGVGPTGPVRTRPGRRPHLAVTASPRVLRPGAVGLAELEGYGPIPASVARDVARDAEWRVVGVDPRTGEACGRSSRAYRPSAELVARVVARDVTCAFPGCRVPADRCDLDHVTPFDADRPAAGQTTEGNLQALCRHHHRMKTHGGWTPVRDPATGVTTWRSPTGHVYTRDPVRIAPDGATDDDDPDPLPPRRRARPTVLAEPPPGTDVSGEWLGRLARRRGAAGDALDRLARGGGTPGDAPDRLARGRGPAGDAPDRLARGRGTPGEATDRLAHGRRAEQDDDGAHGPPPRKEPDGGAAPF